MVCAVINDTTFCSMTWPGKYSNIADLKTICDTDFKKITDFMGGRRWLVSDEVQLLKKGNQVIRLLCIK